MTLTRRDYLKAQAAATAAATAGVTLQAGATQLPTGMDAKVKWSKAACRFCGTGCSVMVGVKEGRIVATHGDQ
jgi:nitrate reductase NapA